MNNEPAYWQLLDEIVAELSGMMFDGMGVAGHQYVGSPRLPVDRATLWVILQEPSSTALPARFIPGTQPWGTISGRLKTDMERAQTAVNERVKTFGRPGFTIQLAFESKRRVDAGGGTFSYFR